MVLAIKKTEILLQSYVSSKHWGSHPIPMKSVSYDVEIVSGLVVVKQTRVFKNEESQPIEATLTFPVGYESIVCDVKATVDGRVLVGQAKAKKEARATYENALDEGKATVLHEELMRGLHMLSAGNLAPGAKIVVEATSIAPMSLVDGNGRYRIPLTIGAIYGTSPLIPSDDIVADGAAMDAKLTISGADGVLINGAAYSEQTIKTSGVIDIVVPNPDLRSLQAPMPSGSWVKVEFGIPAQDDHPLDATLLLDSSGSMNNRPDRGSKWQYAITGLHAALLETSAQDKFQFWTFSDNCVMHGEANGVDAATKVGGLPFEGNGTRLAEAVHRVVGSRSEGNVLLVTDGQSHTPIDFDLVRKSGTRFTVMLIGRGAFESNVAQLAAVTGGQMFVVGEGDDVADVVGAALASMRAVASPIKAISDPQASIRRKLGGLSVDISYSDAKSEEVRELDKVAAFAANLAISALPDVKASELAESVGIVSRLTSIVMVDRDGPEVDGISVNRKVALAASDEILSFSAGLSAAPRSFASASVAGMPSMMAAGAAPKSAFRGIRSSSDSAVVAGIANRGAPPVTSRVAEFIQRAKVLVTGTRGDVEATVGSGVPYSINPGIPSSVDWTGFDWALAAQVVNGSGIAGFGPAERALIGTLASSRQVVALAASLGKTSVAVAIALIAEAHGGSNRQAQRIARHVLGKADRSRVETALKLVP